MNNNIVIVEQAFKTKFGVLPFITFQEVQGYGHNFCILKSENMCMANEKAFYKMGATLEQALNYIDRLIQIPSAVVVFKDEREKRIYNLQIEMNNLYLKKNEEAHNDK